MQPGALAGENGNGVRGAEVMESFGNLRLRGFEAIRGDQAGVDASFAALPLAGLHLFGDVAKDDDRTDIGVFDKNRGARIGDRKAGPVFAPEDLVVPVGAFCTGEGVINGAVLAIVRASVWVRMVDQGVLQLAVHAFGRPAGHLAGGPVREGDVAFDIKAVDAIGGLFQQKTAHLLQTYVVHAPLQVYLGV